MKNIIIVLAFLVITLEMLAQKVDSTSVEKIKIEKSVVKKSEIKELEGEELSVEKTDEDTTKSTNLSLGKKAFKIFNDSDGDMVIVVKDKKNKKKFKHLTSRKGIAGSWASISFGFSNFVDSDFSLTRNDQESFMDLNTGKSYNMNLNFAQYTVNLTKKFLLVTGMGIEWNYYRFDNKNSIMKNSEGNTIERVLDPKWSIDKSAMTTIYATVPLMFEIHSSESKRKDIVFAFGAIAGFKLTSNTRIDYEHEGGETETVTTDDYNIAPFRYGAHARLGVGYWQLFATYYATPFFEKDKGPELYPFTVGLALTFH